MDYFSNYLPENFCRELVLAKGNSYQLLMLMAVVLGIKPLMDDWILKERLPAFLQACKRSGLHLRAESQFFLLSRGQLSGQEIGGRSLTSTIALGFPLEAPGNGMVDCFISRDPERLTDGMWYPLIVRNRVIWPPQADILKYGKQLGYPDCCIKFFRAKNDWQKYSFLYEIYKNSRESFHFFCNPLLKETPYSYIYHMPCTFNCPKTLDLVTALRKEVKKRESRLPTLIDAHLKLPVLVFYEKIIYAFAGKLKAGKLFYRELFAASGQAAQHPYYEELKKGNCLELKESMVLIYQGRRLTGRILPRGSGFAPEYPFLIQFA